MPRATLIAMVAVVAVTAWAAWRILGSGEATPECPSDSIFCDRDAYVAGAAESCVAGTSAGETGLIERTTTLPDYCACIAGKMFDAFDAEALWRLDTGQPPGPERMLMDRQREVWAAACLGG